MHSPTPKTSNNPSSGTRSASPPNGKGNCPYCAKPIDAELPDDLPDVGQLCIGCRRVEHQP
jgi:hypothetical protein